MISKVAHAGWPNCYRLSNDTIDLVATTDVGPRIAHLGFVGGDNLFGGLEEQLGLNGGDEWRLYYGHRFWHSPEAMPRSYYPDNRPVEVEILGDDALALSQLPESTTGMQKTVEIALVDDHVEVAHTLTNMGLWPVEAAAWAISVMAVNSVSIVPQPRGDPQALLPNRTLMLWPYTDMTDPRVRWGHEFITLRQDPGVGQPIKLGLSAEDGWCACLAGETLLVKRFDYIPDVLYPDNGCTVETYASDRFLELETLGPMEYLEPGDAAIHIERWHLYQDVHLDAGNEDDIGRVLRPLLVDTE